MTATRTMLLVLGAALAASGQNGEISLLYGPSNRGSGSRAGIVAGESRGTFQVNHAYRLRELRFPTTIGTGSAGRGSEDESIATGAFEAGAGFSFRLSRRWSVRGKRRNYETASEATLLRRNVLADQVEFALHFR